MTEPGSELREERYRGGLARFPALRLTLGFGLISSTLAACGVGMAKAGPVGIQRLTAGATGTSAPSATGVVPSGIPGGGTKGQVPTGGDDSERADVLSAWRSAELAFETAAVTADASEPALEATTEDPQLSVMRDVLSEMRAAGEAARGPVALGSPAVVGLSGNEASVRSCLHDEEVVYFQATGKPVPGVAGEVADELVVSVMLRNDGQWKLDDQSVQVNACVSP